MGKLVKVKKWFSAADAARHLSIQFGETVTEADVLQLALEGRLSISVNLFNRTAARVAEFILLGNADKTPRAYSPPDGKPRIEGLDGVWHARLAPNVETLTGVWDLALIGDERRYVEDRYQQLAGDPPVVLPYLEGVFVRGEDGQLFELRESFENNEFAKGSRAALDELREQIAGEKMHPVEAEPLLKQHEEQRRKFLADREANRRAGQESDMNYCQAFGLPPDAVLVVRAAALRELEASASDPERAEKPLSTRERQTLLTIIAALCKKAELKPDDRGVAMIIAKATEELGAPVSDDTVRNALKQIPNALEIRQK
jgi:hypothetical protein